MVYVEFIIVCGVELYPGTPEENIFRLQEDYSLL